ncbi:heterokaryon incompatibility protein-domain-containing protein [Hypoxylon rubiginosum]|uniref:Heterokaryon incompatibility protein-domain-containing protein n=1 Tax=Hypoxylon rubiginosum TaxID=110542 RepID=A0ACB9YU00_9PEZI|nr:heterokaryon incompatibility protein-domain-containing protein [Hypoxylon rubiginosum]
MNDKPLYRALSYVWGSPTERVDIEVNGELLSIGSNLRAALLQLRQDQDCPSIWVDSICIEQTNTAEKSWHVNEMGKIFSGTEQVYLWLGPAADGSDEVMDFISHIGPTALQLGDISRPKRVLRDRIRDYVIDRSAAGENNQHIHQDTIEASDSETVDEDRVTLIGDFILGLTQNLALLGGHEQSLIPGIECLLRRDYWHRVWIVQEVSLAKVATVVCGQKTVALDLFDAVFSAVWFTRQWVAVERLFSPFFLPLQANLYGTIKCISVWRERRKGRSVLLRDVLLEYGESPQRPHYTATDPRDIVFGILGVISDLADLDVHADYSKSTAEVYASVARAMIYRYDEDPNAFQYHLGICNPANTSSDLPSWVLDFRKVGQYGIASWPISYSAMFSASKGASQPRNARNNCLDDPSVLRRRGCLVDVVTEVMAQPQWYHEDGHDLYLDEEIAWLRSVIDFTNIATDPSPAEDYVWRTLLLDDKMGGAEYLRGKDNEVAQLIRRIVRRHKFHADELSSTQVDWIRRGSSIANRDRDDLAGMAQTFSEGYTFSLSMNSRHRTLFKTADGRLGLADKSIRAGDLVTLIWGVNAPVILRERENDGGFIYLGEAYVTDIMYGEYLETRPPEKDFDLY